MILYGLCDFSAADLGAKAQLAFMQNGLNDPFALAVKSLLFAPLTSRQWRIARFLRAPVQRHVMGPLVTKQISNSFAARTGRTMANMRMCIKLLTQ